MATKVSPITIPHESAKEKDIRCPQCNRLLARAKVWGKIELKCVRCKSLTTVDA